MSSYFNTVCFVKDGTRVLYDVPGLEKVQIMKYIMLVVVTVMIMIVMMTVVIIIIMMMAIMIMMIKMMIVMLVVIMVMMVIVMIDGDSGKLCVNKNRYC